MDKYVVLKKSDFNGFIKSLSKTQKVMAPVAKGNNNYAFEEVSSGEEISISHIPTILPPKKYFMPQRETILAFSKKEHEWKPILEKEPLVVFGIHTCDLEGIQLLNKVFTTPPQDTNYINRMNDITTIGLECNDYCDEYASCCVMNNHLPNSGYDLFFTELSNDFMVHILTEKGEKITGGTPLFSEAQSAHHKALEQLRSKKKELFKDEVVVQNNELKELFARTVHSAVWEDIQNRCVACGNCTNVCPTCYCFDIKDDINLDLNTGVRIRSWDSCQNETFAKVAGGENFREERGSRQRHRYMRKFNYSIGKFNKYFCTGCGRCSRTCMAKINLKETINSLAGEKK